MSYDALAFLQDLFRIDALDDLAGEPGAGVQVEDLDAEWRVRWEERAAIMEYDGGMHRERAEALALEEIQRLMLQCQFADTPNLRKEKMSEALDKDGKRR